MPPSGGVEVNGFSLCPLGRRRWRPKGSDQHVVGGRRRGALVSLRDLRLRYLGRLQHTPAYQQDRPQSRGPVRPVRSSPATLASTLLALAFSYPRADTGQVSTVVEFLFAITLPTAAVFALIGAWRA